MNGLKGIDFFICLQVVWYHMYARDSGTLYAMRNCIDARNVSNDPHNRYYEASEFLNNVRDA